MSDKVKVAVIGAGNMGRYHLRNYAALEHADLVAVADPNPNTKKLATEYGIKYYKDYISMLDREKPDAVSIAVPTPFHLEIGSSVMERGIHCLVEKPIAHTVKEADILIGLAEKLDVVFTVGHIERYNPLIQAVKKQIDSKALGKITSIICQRVGGPPAIEPKTDVIVDLAVHDIDLINYLLGRLPDNVYSHGSSTHISKIIDSAELLLDYGNASGFVQANWISPVKIRTIAITGSHGYMEGNYITQELTYYKHNMQDVTGSFKNFVGKLGEPQRKKLAVRFEEPLAVELSTFLKAILSKNEADLVSPWDAREALRLALEAVRKTF